VGVGATEALGLGDAVGDADGEGLSLDVAPPGDAAQPATTRTVAAKATSNRAAGVALRLLFIGSMLCPPRTVRQGGKSPPRGPKVTNRTTVERHAIRPLVDGRARISAVAFLGAIVLACLALPALALS
jgi:hypothetical protein